MLQRLRCGQFRWFDCRGSPVVRIDRADEKAAKSENDQYDKDDVDEFLHPSVSQSILPLRHRELSPPPAEL